MGAIVRAAERLGPPEFNRGYIVRRVLREPEPTVACPECGSPLEDQITFRSCPKCEHCEEKTKTPHRKVCAWCKREVSPGIEPASHTICEACLKEHDEEL